MFRSKSLVLTLMILILVATPVLAQNQQPPAKNVKAAYVNMQRVLQSDSTYEKAMKDLQKYRRDLKRQIQTKRQELQKLQKQLQKESQLLSQQQRKQKQKQLRRKMQSLQQRAQQSQQMMQQKRQKLLQPILKKIDPVVRSVAQEKGYNVIYSYGQRDNPSVLWVSEKLNITNDIIDRLQAE